MSNYYLENQASFISIRKSADGGPYACPCCNCFTLETRGSSEVCDVCYWEDDGQDDHDADIVRGGPNADLSLVQARLNYQEFRACERSAMEHVRAPLPHERTR